MAPLPLVQRAWHSWLPKTAAKRLQDSLNCASAASQGACMVGGERQRHSGGGSRPCRVAWQVGKLNARGLSMNIFEKFTVLS